MNSLSQRASNRGVLPGPAALLCLILLLLTCAVAVLVLSHWLPLSLWAQAILAPDYGDARQAVMHFSLLPRLVVTLLAGAGLALAGVLMQQVLRNPLASPTTLGVASGAQLALLLATLLAPGLLVAREWIAMAGGTGAMALVFMLTWRRDLNPLVIVFAGLVINLYLGAISLALLLFHQEELKGMLVWGSGALAQDSWEGVSYLLPRLLLGLGLAALLLRPLAVLELDDASARSLGIALKKLRFAGLGVAVFVTACVVSVVGIIGFIGLAAPIMVRLLGARSLGQRLLWAPLLGALLLSLTDLLLQGASRFWPLMIPTGAMTALLGAPLLLWLIPRLALHKQQPKMAATLTIQRHSHPSRLLWGLGFALLLALIGSLALGQGVNGWSWPSLARWQAQWEWRLPRTLAAAAAGILLALAGTLLQRVSRNPMASPELLGVSGGTVMGLLLAAFLLPALPLPLMLLAGVAGAVLVLLLLLALNRRSGFQPERILLCGIAITAMLDPVQSIALANGDPRVQLLLAWISGSTYYVTGPMALGLALLAGIMLSGILALGRWLDILPLGSAAAGALGLNTRRVQLLILLLVALLTASATLVIGPLSFVGLLAPHMAKLMGLVRARAHLLGASLCGALLMVLADWAGQQLLFPMEIPTGLVSTLLGGAYFMWCLRRL